MGFSIKPRRSGRWFGLLLLPFLVDGAELLTGKALSGLALNADSTAHLNITSTKLDGHWNRPMRLLYGDLYHGENKNAPLFDHLLEWWGTYAAGKGLQDQYSIGCGTLLAENRHPKHYIPYDGDMDMHLGGDAIKVLMLVAEDPNDTIVLRTDRLHSYPFELNSPRILVAAEKQRYNCLGETVVGKDDRCTFLRGAAGPGPIARVIMMTESKGHPRGRFTSMDLWPYMSKAQASAECVAEMGDCKPVGTQGGDLCMVAPPTCFQPLPPLRDCKLSHVQTRCVYDTDAYLSSMYGKHFRTPQIYSDSKVQSSPTMQKNNKALQAPNQFEKELEELQDVNQDLKKSVAEKVVEFRKTLAHEAQVEQDLETKLGTESARAEQAAVRIKALSKEVQDDRRRYVAEIEALKASHKPAPAVADAIAATQ